AAGAGSDRVGSAHAARAKPRPAASAAPTLWGKRRPRGGGVRMVDAYKRGRPRAQASTRLAAGRTTVVESTTHGSRSARLVARRAADSSAPRAARSVHAHRRPHAYRGRNPAADSVRRGRLLGRALDRRLGSPHPVAPRDPAPLCPLHGGAPARAGTGARGAPARDRLRGPLSRVRRV